MMTNSKRYFRFLSSLLFLLVLMGRGNAGGLPSELKVDVTLVWGGQRAIEGQEFETRRKRAAREVEQDLEVGALLRDFRQVVRFERDESSACSNERQMCRRSEANRGTRSEREIDWGRKSGGRSPSIALKGRFRRARRALQGRVGLVCGASISVSGVWVDSVRMPVFPSIHLFPGEAQDIVREGRGALNLLGNPPK